MTTSNSPTKPARALATLASTTAAFALSRGMTMDQVQRVTGISGLDLVDPDARLPEEVVPRLWQALSEREPNRALAIEMASAAPFTFFGGLAHGVQFADTLRTALGFMVQSRALLADRLSMALHERDDVAELVVSHPADAIDQGQTAQLGTALASRMLSEILGVEDALVGVEFAYPSHGDIEVYERHFGLRPKFNARRNALVLRRVTLEATTSQANLELFAYVEQHFDKALERIGAKASVSALAPLHRVLAERASLSSFNPEFVAARAGLSLRAAQRLAQANGTTLKDLIEEVRYDSAKELLGNPRMNIETVADLVGYSDGRAFRRAFKRWSGQTPSEFRQSMVGIT